MGRKGPVEEQLLPLLFPAPAHTPTGHGRTTLCLVRSLVHFAGVERALPHHHQRCCHAHGGGGGTVGCEAAGQDKVRVGRCSALPGCSNWAAIAAAARARGLAKGLRHTPLPQRQAPLANISKTGRRRRRRRLTKQGWEVALEGAPQPGQGEAHPEGQLEGDGPPCGTTRGVGQQRGMSVLACGAAVPRAAQARSCTARNIADCPHKVN